MYIRLESVASDLVREVSWLSPDQQLTLRQVVVTRAVEEVELGSEPLVIRGLAELVDGPFGHSEIRSLLASLAEATDEQAWGLQEVGNDAAESSAYLEQFRRARAISSLVFALGDASTTSTLECVYEAHAAIGNIDVVRNLISAGPEGIRP